MIKIHILLHITLQKCSCTSSLHDWSF